MSLLTSFYNDWLEHPNYWFKQSNQIDEYLTFNYKYLIDIAWDSTNTNIQYHLTHILINDQLIRHIERNKDSQHIILYHLQKAISIHYHIQEFYYINNDLNCIEWCFWGLPIRHLADTNQIMNVLEKSWKKLQYEKMRNSDIIYLKKFIQATYQRMPVGQINYINKYIPDNLISFTNLENYKPILDFFPENKPSYTPSNLSLIIKKFINNYSIDDTVILSISGGVDSMVCSYILKQLNINVIGLHINYCNREDTEASFVQDWCNYIGMPVYIRNFKEIQRNPCMENDMRSTYETYTRNVRYECYRTLWNEIINKNCDKPPLVVLGHNHDDCFENILTNICHQHKYDNLTGMNESQMVDGICFLRPLLTISKKLIYNEAHTIGIPYLKDSTPSWSQRGQIRDNIKPSLDKWDPRMINAMFELTNILKESEQYKQNLLVKLVEFTTKTNNNIYLNLSDMNFKIGYSLWKLYLQHNGIQIKHRSLENFIEQFETRSKNFQCILTKEWKVIVQSSKINFIKLY